jgi:hypothetical protein
MISCFHARMHAHQAYAADDALMRALQYTDSNMFEDWDTTMNMSLATGDVGADTAAIKER